MQHEQETVDTGPCGVKIIEQNHTQPIGDKIIQLLILYSLDLLHIIPKQMTFKRNVHNDTQHFTIGRYRIINHYTRKVFQQWTQQV